MNEYAIELMEMQPTKDFLVAIDSDGCVFDAMGIKQRECFCPMMIAHFNLQPVAKAARECKEFADLFSVTRGANRHITIARILTELLPAHPTVLKSGFEVPRLSHYISWVNDPDSMLSNSGLAQAVNNADGQAKIQLKQALTWSLRVDEMVAEVVKNIPPFQYVRQSLEKMIECADVIICSSTPFEALQREWAEHDMSKYVKVIAGQEMGKKQEHLAIMCDKYDKSKIVMIGDALGDLDAARKNDVLFYPIIPDNECESWKKFHGEVFDQFINGNYAGDSEDAAMQEFEKCLPTYPSWLNEIR
jgi:soluble P-type ATPase